MFFPSTSEYLPTIDRYAADFPAAIVVQNIQKGSPWPSPFLPDTLDRFFLSCTLAYPGFASAPVALAVHS